MIFLYIFGWFLCGALTSVVIVKGYKFNLLTGDLISGLFFGPVGLVIWSLGWLFSDGGSTVFWKAKE